MGAPSSEPRWCFLVVYTDQASRVECWERHLWERTARERAESLRRSGFWNVRVRPQRVKDNQPAKARGVLGVNGQCVQG